MDLRIGHLTFRADRSEIGAIPAEPPPDALRDVDRAAARADELWHDKRELHFEMNEDSGRVVVQVRDLDGGVIRTISPSEALDVMSARSGDVDRPPLRRRAPSARS